MLHTSLHISLFSASTYASVVARIRLSLSVKVSMWSTATTSSIIILFVQFYIFILFLLALCHWFFLFLWWTNLIQYILGNGLKCFVYIYTFHCAALYNFNIIPTAKLFCSLTTDFSFAFQIALVANHNSFYVLRCILVDPSNPFWYVSKWCLACYVIDKYDPHGPSVVCSCDCVKSGK